MSSTRRGSEVTLVIAAHCRLTKQSDSRVIDAFWAGCIAWVRRGTGRDLIVEMNQALRRYTGTAGIYSSTYNREIMTARNDLKQAALQGAHLDHLVNVLPDES